MYCTPDAKKTKDSYDFCTVDTDQIIIKFTPPENRYYSRNKYSPRILSKSVPRRNRTLIRYKINRSLNFDICNNKKNNYFLSPIGAKTEESTNRHSPTNNLSLSRSAKILKALNIEYSPMKSGYQKISKTLNFDQTPSPKKFPKITKRRHTISGLLPRINKSLNYDSCDDSTSVESNHETSIESIDENENQTPQSQKNKVDKFSSCISSSLNVSNSSLDFNLLSPTLRPDLREKIDDIVHASMISLQKPAYRSFENLMMDDDDNDNEIVAISTPRNLYKDFSDDNDDRPETPENVVELIPESKSAIKKSHRKERYSRRFLHKVMIHKSLNKDAANSERPATPTIIAPSPTYSIHSIKKSHKKDKSKRRICEYNSNGNQSDAGGSLIEYCRDVENLTKYKENTSIDDSDDEKNNLKVEEMDSSIEDNVDVVSLSPDNTPTRSQLQIATPDPKTPDNRIDYLKKIMTDSIKKSHKKLKDSNKKILFSARFKNIDKEAIDDLMCLENMESIGHHENHVKEESLGESSLLSSLSSTSGENSRACTPENVNSSRLLLAQFSSVKKSHRKDKHGKSKFAVYHAQNHTVNDDNNDDFKIGLKNIKHAVSVSSKVSSSSSSSSCHDEKNRYHSLQNSSIDTGDDDIKLLIYSSPNKRKNLSSDELSENLSISSDKLLHLADDKCATQDEFKICTPIKKRRAYISIPRELNDCSTPIKIEESQINERCETPKLKMSFLNIQENNVADYENVDESNVNHVLVENDDETDRRTTPKNHSNMRIIAASSSIKKSHRKDKWTKSRRLRFLQHDFKNDLKFANSKGLMNSPKPSTSYSNEDSNDDKSLLSPQASSKNLDAKLYQRLAQTESIKRSHKKRRERKRQNTTVDLNLSDDGSLFDEEEKSKHIDNSSMGNFQRFDDQDFAPLDDYENNIFDVKYSASASRLFKDNRSNDGSIFGSDDEIDC